MRDNRDGKPRASTDDRELIEAIKSAWGRPGMSDQERRCFDQELAGRLEQKRRHGPFGMVVAGVVSLVVALFVIQARTGHREGPTTATGGVGKGQVHLIPQSVSEESSTTVAEWVDSLITPEADSLYLSELTQEYQAIATWLSSGGSSSGQASGSKEGKEEENAN